MNSIVNIYRLITLHSNTYMVTANILKCVDGRLQTNKTSLECVFFFLMNVFNRLLIECID